MQKLAENTEEYAGRKAISPENVGTPVGEVPRGIALAGWQAFQNVGAGLGLLKVEARPADDHFAPAVRRAPVHT